MAPVSIPSGFRLTACLASDFRPLACLRWLASALACLSLGLGGQGSGRERDRREGL